MNVSHVGDSRQRQRSMQPNAIILIKTTESVTKLVLPGRQHLVEFTGKSSLVGKEYNTCIDGISKDN